MPTKDAVALLNEFLTIQARLAVARLRDPSVSPSASSEYVGVFTGFFVSPAGHLLTAFHPLKHRLWDTEYSAEFELAMDFDVTGRPAGARPRPRTVPAVCQAGWSDFRADWAILKLDYAPSSYLPVAAPGHLQPPTVDLCSTVRAYGFTEDQPGSASLGAYEGQFARVFPEISQFRMGFVDRGVGQSGGPVIDLRNRTVIGVVSGLYQRRELLTADAAVVDQATLGRPALDIDLQGLASDWRGAAAQYLSSHLTEYELLAAERPALRLPETYLSGRVIGRNVLAALTDNSEPVIFLHGARGSGKTSIATEVVRGLRDRGVVESVFWYDFDQAKRRSGDHLIPGLALHLLASRGAFEPMERWSYGQANEDTAETIASLSAAVRHGRQALVFENVHFPQRERRADVLLLLEHLARAAAAGDSKVLFTSWDAPSDPLRFTTRTVDGLTASELAEFFRLYGLDLSAQALSYIREYAADIVCLEMFVRSSEWRAAVEAGQRLPKEPGQLLTYWVKRYTKEHVPAPALSILLALAVLEQRADYETLEAVSATEGFHETLELLRTSPPLIRREREKPPVYTVGDGAPADRVPRDSYRDYYTAHLNVRRAVLTASDSKQIVATHERAADFWAGRQDFGLSARHRLGSGDYGHTLALIREHREAIIAAGDIKTLEDLADELLARSPAARDDPYALHIIRASCRNIRGDYAGAGKHWSYALRNPPDALGEAMLHNRRADSYRLASEYQLAGDDYTRAAAIAGAGGTVACQRELGRARLGLAKLARLTADYRQARQNYSSAHDAFEECFDEQGLIETEFGIGEVSRLTHDWDDSLRAYSDSLARSRKAGNAERVAYALWGVGEVQRLTGDYLAAAAAHRQGRAICEDVGDTRSEGWALLGLAETNRATGALDLALTGYVTAKDRFVRTKSGTEVAHATLGWCEAERTAGRLHLGRYDAVERTYRDKGLRHCLVLCRLAQAAALRTAGRAADADADACVREASTVASAAGLRHELSVAGSMLSDPASAPYLALNFP